MASSTSRLRKAFRYPSDSDSDDPADLDEEHQEQLIASLQTEDARKTALYRRLFLSIPLSATLFFFYSFITASTAQQRLISFLSVSSLACTAYILEYMPLGKEDRKGKTPVYQIEAAKGPLERYLIWLNTGLVGLLEIAAVVSWKKGEAEDAVRDSLGMIVFGLMMVARVMLRPTDMGELERARYELKGA